MKWTWMVLMLGAGGAVAAEKPAPQASSESRPAAPAAPAAPKKKKPQAKPGAQAKKAGEPVPESVPALPPQPAPPPTVSGLMGLDDEELPTGLEALPPDVKVPPIYRQPFVWDVPKVLDIVDVPGVMLADGIPVRMKAVRSGEKPEPLLQHMVDRWNEWGLYIAPVEQQKQLLREAMLTALDPERLITYTIILQPNPDGTTTVYLGEADMSKPPTAMSSVAPVFPGAQGVMTSELEVVRSVSYTVGVKESEVEDFYRKELGKAGFKEVKPRIFRAGQEEVELLFNAQKAGQLSVSVLRRTVAPEARKPNGD